MRLADGGRGMLSGSEVELRAVFFRFQVELGNEEENASPGRGEGTSVIKHYGQDSDTPCGGWSH